MGVWKQGLYALGVLSVASALTACNGGASLPATPGQATTASAVARGPHASYASPDLHASAKVLFVSDQNTENVYLYKVSSLTLLATITGFRKPLGMCSDPSGNVWVADSLANTLTELSHTGSVVNTLSDSAGQPWSCAVDSTTGNLAVANVNSPNGLGNLVIFPHGSGTPTVITIPNQQTYEYVGYDPRGNLYVDGESEYFTNTLAQCKKGNQHCKLLNLNTQIGFAGLLQWNKSGHYLDVGDRGCTSSGACIYHVTVSGSAATVVGTTQLDSYVDGKTCGMGQGAIALIDGKATVVGGDDEVQKCEGASSSIDLWPYPSGGEPTKYATNGIVAPIGIAVSSSN